MEERLDDMLLQLEELEENEVNQQEASKMAEKLIDMYSQLERLEENFSACLVAMELLSAKVFQC